MEAFKNYIWKFFISLLLRVSFPGSSDGKESTCNAGDTGDAGSVPWLGKSLEKKMVTHSSILAWKTPWTEEPGGLQSKGSQRCRHDLLRRLSEMWGLYLSLNPGWPSDQSINRKQQNWSYMISKSRVEKVMLLCAGSVILLREPWATMWESGGSHAWRKPRPT